MNEHGKPREGKPPRAGLEDVVLELQNIVTALRAGLPGSHDHGDVGHMVIHLVAVELKPKGDPPVTPTTDHMPDFTLPKTTERALLQVVGAKLPSGSYVPSVSWRTSDTTALPIEARPDDVERDSNGLPVLDDQGNQIPVFSVYANTPLEPPDGTLAEGIITVSSSGMADCDVKVRYGNPAVGHFAITAAEAAE